MKTRGFTIVELLVVISVIGILAAVSITWVTSSVNRATRDSAVSTAQQVKQELSAYFSSKGRYPRQLSEVTAFLRTERNKADLATEFEKTALYGYLGTTADGSTCYLSSQPACETYTITVKKTGWNGSSVDQDILVTP